MTLTGKLTTDNDLSEKKKLIEELVDDNIKKSKDDKEDKYPKHYQGD